MRPPFKRQGRLRLRLPADHRNHVHFALRPRQWPPETVYIEAWRQHVQAGPFPYGIELNLSTVDSPARQRAFDHIQRIARELGKDLW